MKSLLLVLALVLAGVSNLLAQETTVRLAPLVATPLARFESLSTGISFQPPTGFSFVRRMTGEEIISYADLSRTWVIRLECSDQDEKMSLSIPDAGPAPLAASQPPQAPSFLNTWAEKQRTLRPGCEFLRLSVAPRGRSLVGNIAIRFKADDKVRLAIQNILQLTPKRFVILEMSGPAAAIGAGPIGANEAERQLDSAATDLMTTLSMRDLLGIREEQDRRLLHTRGLFLDWTETRLKSAVVSERYFRIIHQGRDIGYSYVSEEASDVAGSKGISVSLRTRLIPDTQKQIDTESWYFVSFDRRNEQFVNRVLNSGDMGKSLAIESGSSTLQVTRRLDPSAAPDPKDRKQPLTRENYRLVVEQKSNAKSLPAITRDLPPYYVPQALGYLTPRIVPLNQPDSYIFASWVSEKQEVYMRYIDVMREQQIDLNGQSFRAVPVKDRFGLDGAVVTHYVTRDGKYLGSRDEDTGQLFVGSDRAELLKLWTNANLDKHAGQGMEK